jgi:pyruvate dehydrogenase E1 component
MAPQTSWSSPVDIDDEELAEWRDSVDAVVAAHDPEAASRVLRAARARSLGVAVPGVPATDYENTIPPGGEPVFPGDEALEARIRHYLRWNAAVMVARANRRADGIGGHLATYASAATLYEVGFNHFFRGADAGPGDQV